MRLIDADKITTKEICYYLGQSFASCEEKMRDMINDQPTVDAIPAVHAHWEYDPNGMDWNMGAWRCSKCKERNNNIGGDEKINPLLFAGSSYCPSCGAKMRGE